MTTVDPFFDPAELDRVERAAAEWIRAQVAAGADLIKCFPMRRIAERKASRNAETNTMKT